MIKKLFFICSFTLCSKALFAQIPQNDSVVVNRIASYILDNHQCYNDLKYLCKQIGNRITGSQQAQMAVEWGEKTLQNAGCDKVYLQPVKVPVWVRGEEETTIQFKNGNNKKLQALSLGNSIGTGKQGLQAPIIEVRDTLELQQFGIENIKGKIVFFNHAWNQKIKNPFEEYGNSVYYRWAGASVAAKYGAVGVIIRSAGSGIDSFAHTGSMRYDTNFKKIPIVAISYLEAIYLQDALRAKEVASATIKNTCHFENEITSYNVIGEIKGTDVEDEIITVGGHLDSWDVGEGAQDDGAGVVQSIEVVRAFKKLGIKPRRTIRCVLFMNEENGLRGGTEYARVAKEKNEKHICAIETDAGGYSPRGFTMQMPENKKAKIKAWKNIFAQQGVYNFDEDGGGADISPLAKNMNVPVMELSPDPQRYFDLHHTNNDVFEQVNWSELSMGAASLVSMVYLLSVYGL